MKNIEAVDRSILKEYEDNFQFPVQYMKDLCANTIRFSSTQCHDLDDGGEPSRHKIDSIRGQLFRVYASCNEDPVPLLEEDGFILKSIRETYLGLLEDDTYKAFEYLVMVR